jgi:hypothetical protein
MEQDFAEFFGKVHIETGATSSREKVTKLEFIRWRTKIFGAPGQYNPRPKTTTLPPRVLLSSSLSNSLPSTATPTSSPSSSSSSSSSLPLLISQLMATPRRSALEKGVAISTAQQDQDTMRFCTDTFGRECPKNCATCGDDGGGSVNVCENQNCKNVLANDINPN